MKKLYNYYYVSYLKDYLCNPKDIFKTTPRVINSSTKFISNNSLQNINELKQRIADALNIQDPSSDQTQTPASAQPASVEDIKEVIKTYIKKLNQALTDKDITLSDDYKNPTFDEIGDNHLSVTWGGKNRDYPAMQFWVVKIEDSNNNYQIRFSYIWGGNNKGFISNTLIPDLIDTLDYANVENIIIPQITSEQATCSYLRGILERKHKDLKIELIGLINCVDNNDVETCNTYKNQGKHTFNIRDLTSVTGPAVGQCGKEGEIKGDIDKGPVIKYNGKYLQMINIHDIKIFKTPASGPTSGPTSGQASGQAVV